VSSSAIPASLIVNPVRRDPQRMPRGGSCPDAASPDIGAITPPVITGLPDEAASWCGSPNLDPRRRRTDAEIRLRPCLWRSGNDGKDCRRDELRDVPHGDLPSPAVAAKHLPAFNWPFFASPGSPSTAECSELAGFGHGRRRMPLDSFACPHMLRLASSRPCSFSAGTRSPLTRHAGRTS
jgi:hypothetical protein